MLLAHDGELADVRAQLETLEVELLEQAPERVEVGDCALVVTTARAALRVGRPLAPHIAVVQQDSPGLRDELRRAGVDLVVRPDCHPTALRLLLLHALYRGPERRRRARVLVGAAVSYRAGLRRRTAILADLSTDGCRLLVSQPLGYDQRVTVHLPGDVAGGEGLRMRGRVARTGPAPGLASAHAVAVAFESVSSDERERLRAVVSAAAGPVPLLSDACAVPATRPDPPPSTDAAKGQLPERRSEPRRAYERRVVAEGEDAARVLLGRDLSSGGMRVELEPDLRIGERLRLALHVEPGRPPLEVEGWVARDDGRLGLLVRFVGLDAGRADYLEQMLDRLPVLDTGHAPDDAEGVVVSEILERVSA